MLLSKLKVAVAAMLAIGALGIGASALPHATVAAEPPSPPSKSDVASQDDGNLKETVLALNKRLWEAHTKQDVNTFKNLLADDFMGLDIYRRPYRKTGALEHVSKYRVEDSAMSNVKVILLNTTSAIVTSESRFKVLLADGKLVETRADYNTTAWARRDGKWWAVFTESMVIGKDRAFRNVIGLDGESPALRFNLQTREQEVEGLSETLKKLNYEKKPPED